MPLDKGVAFPLIAPLKLNKLDDDPLVEVILLSEMIRH